MNRIELDGILDRHRIWLSNEIGGVRADLRGACLERANLQGADLRGACLQGADLRGADLQGADLRGADLQGANLERADLRGACLERANLRGAYLREADLREADLQGADLRGADLRGADINYIIEDALLEKIANTVISNKETLQMLSWHSLCGTAHCIAGWACTLAKNGKDLEDKLGTQVAGLMLLGQEAHSHFFDSDEEAFKYLQESVV